MKLKRGRTYRSRFRSCGYRGQTLEQAAYLIKMTGLRADRELGSPDESSEECSQRCQSHGR